MNIRVVLSDVRVASGGAGAHDLHNPIRVASIQVFDPIATRDARTAALIGDTVDI
jgi:hypothetical protein